jgi:mono/diheme cytochrome c family protein
MHQFRIGRRTGFGLAVVACVVALSTPVALGHSTTHQATPATGNIANGYVIFNKYFCADCHTLKAGGPMAYGQLGVNMDKVKGPLPVLVAAVTNGLPAALPLYPTQMVGFKNVLTTSEINDVTSFILKYQGTHKTCSECPTTTP